MTPAERLEEVVDFWYSSKANSKWWDKDPEFDEHIRKKFLETYNLALSDKFEYQPTPRRMLGHIILFDQLPRNMFRGHPNFVATDERALDLAKTMIERKWHINMSPEKQRFIYMPFKHSENLENQKISVKLYSGSSGQPDYFTLRHYEIIERFGRFPHRNSILGRPSTTEEIDFLNQPNSSF